jgi:hypothetical protein
MELSIIPDIAPIFIMFLEKIKEKFHSPEYKNKKSLFITDKITKMFITYYILVILNFGLMEIFISFFSGGFIGWLKNFKAIFFEPVRLNMHPTQDLVFYEYDMEKSVKNKIERARAIGSPIGYINIRNPDHAVAVSEALWWKESGDDNKYCLAWDKQYRGWWFTKPEFAQTHRPTLYIPGPQYAHVFRCMNPEGQLTKSESIQLIHDYTQQKLGIEALKEESLRKRIIGVWVLASGKVFLLEGKQYIVDDSNYSDFYVENNPFMTKYSPHDKEHCRKTLYTKDSSGTYRDTGYLSHDFTYQDDYFFMKGMNNVPQKEIYVWGSVGELNEEMLFKKKKTAGITLYHRSIDNINRGNLIRYINSSYLEKRIEVSRLRHRNYGLSRS